MTNNFKLIACTIAIAAGTLLFDCTSVLAQARPNPNLLRGNSLTKASPRPLNVRAPIVSNNTNNVNSSQNNYANPGYNMYAPGPYSAYPGQYQNVYPGINSGYSPYGVNPYGSSPYGYNPYGVSPYGYNPYGFFPGY